MPSLRTCRAMTTALALSACCLSTNVASAQQGSMFGASSPLTGVNGMGNGSTGVPGIGGALGSTSSAFGSSMSGAGIGSGLNAGSLGSQFGTGMTTSPTGGGGRSTLLGANNTQNGFLGATQQGAGSQGQNRNQQGMNGQRNGNNRNQAGNRGANRGNNQQQQQQQFTNQGQGANAKKSIRPQLRVAFDSPRPKTDVTTKNLTVRLDNFAKRSALSGVDVVVDGGKVTLRGQVDTEESRRLAGMLVALEPGVRSVQNDLTVSSPPPPEPGE